ncbi:unnamed protein product [Effrenium voratum]|nr:unnamed protein product [Effrenium voratum]
MGLRFEKQVVRQASLSKAVTEKLQGIIGGYGELSVLVEYISVMLQSSRPPETIQAELEAFLQDKSGPFTSWLCEKLAKIVEGGSKRKREKDGGEKKAKKERSKEKKSAAPAASSAAASAAAAAAAAASAAPASAAPARSRSRKRRKAKLTDRKAKLTPNVDFQEPRADEARWSFRAEAGPPGGASAPPREKPEDKAAYAAPPGYMPPGYPARPAAPMPSFAPAAAAPAPVFFAPKKWRVARGNTVVRKSEKLDSEEVQKLQEGEIVEQVAPAFTTENGIIRVQIRHPSSPLFPKPIGTPDASAAGGPKFLEPGPEPMKQPWASSGSAWAPPWRPRGVPPPRPAYAKSFQNLTWTPS